MTDDTTNDAEHSVRRDTAGLQARKRSRRRAVARWLAAGAGMGLLLRTGAEQAEAANGDTVRAGQTTDSTTSTRLRTNVASLTPDTTVDGLQGYADGANNAGLFGRNNASNGIGVAGAASSGTGVFGQSTNGFGVGGQSDANHGVYGKSTSGIGVNAVSGSGFGVYAKSTSNTAVRAESTSGIAVMGTTDVQTAVFGQCTSTQSPGVWGDSKYAGIRGTTPVESGYAGLFDGRVLVNGSFTAMGAKSAAVPHPDGTLRRLYCLESPESFFEDFGQGQLTGGRAQVRLDPDFIVVVRAGDYSVFLTPEGDCRGLYVTAKTPGSFEVRELQGGTCGISFRYRVVAHRKDVQGPRFERVIPPREGLPLPTGPGVGGRPSPTQPSPEVTPVPTATTRATSTSGPLPR
ncbi:MAG: hypothetical protein IT305_29995 [Chloroflexi bacterium]|nr:hypothetical protein [Chloroflexota bacterium]